MSETVALSRLGAEDAIERYVDFWNAEFAGDQQRLASLTFADRVEYHAPIGVLHGADAMIDFRNEFALHQEGVRFRLTAAPEVLDDRARLRWEILVGPDGVSFAAGTDVVQFDGDGRIGSVSAFVDRAPVGFDPHADHDPTPRREGRW
jgi:hypothetical protein